MSLTGAEGKVVSLESLPRCRSSFLFDSHAVNIGMDEPWLSGERLVHVSALADNLTDDESLSVTSSTMAGHVPALTRGNSVASSSRASVQTDMADVQQGGYVLQSDGEVLVLPQSRPFRSEPYLLCPFQILDCIETFADVREFKTHVFSHFQGHPTLPTFAPCFLCDARFHQTSEDDPALAWNNMLSHMVHIHYRQGQEYGVMRADFGLMRWMYDRKIIDDHDFKRTQICPQPVALPLVGTTTSTTERSEMPFAPSPPASSVSLSSRLSRLPDPESLSTGYHGQAYITFAGARAERRRRASLRPFFHRHAEIVN